MAAEVAAYVPGYRLRVPPQFTDDRVSIFLEVEGRGDFLATYAGNLDIMTAAAVRVGEELARARAGAGVTADLQLPRRCDRRPELNLQLMPAEPLKIRITDSCLRDGSHAVRHQLSTEQVRAVVAALDRAGVPVLEVAHGDGLGGSSFTYGFSSTPERELIATAVATARQARIAALLLPGIGTAEDIHAVAGPRRLDHPHRHPLQRGRHLGPALPDRPRSWGSRRSGS